MPSFSVTRPSVVWDRARLASIRGSISSLPVGVCAVKDIAIFSFVGKGPLKDAFEARLAGLDLRYFYFKTCWLSRPDYFSLLGSADLGVCLHASSSGLDLPMKLVDMIGCNLPLLARHYSPAMSEEICPVNPAVLTFETASELSQRFLELFYMIGVGNGSKRLREMREKLAETYIASWDMHWRERVMPALPKKEIEKKID